MKPIVCFAILFFVHFVITSISLEAATKLTAASISHEICWYLSTSLKGTRLAYVDIKNISVHLTKNVYSVAIHHLIH